MDPSDEQRRAANLAVVQRYADAWRTGDAAALIACYHDEFTLHYGGANPLSGKHAGKAVALGVLARVSQRTKRRLVRIVEAIAGGERAVVIAREHFSRDGREEELERTLVYTVRDGLLHACWVYDHDQVLVDWYLRDA